MAYTRIYEGLIVEIRTGGSSLNGGAFAAPSETESSGTDRSQQDSPHVDTADASVSAATKTGTSGADRESVILSGFTVSSADVGNCVQISSTGDSGAWTGLFLITSVDSSANSWRFTQDVRDSSLDTSSTNVELRMGGAWDSLGTWGKHVDSSGGSDYWFADSASRVVWVKAGASAYSLSTTTVNESGGPVEFGNSSTCPLISGYGTTRGDNTQAEIGIGSTGYTGYIIEQSTGRYNSNTIQNIKLDCGGTASGFKRSGGYGCIQGCYSCTVVNCDTTSGVGFYRFPCVNCLVDGAKYGFENNGTLKSCVATDCAEGFHELWQYPTSCLAYDCTIGFYDNQSQNGGGLDYCVADGCTSGFKTKAKTLRHCVATNCTTGFDFFGSNFADLLIAGYGYNNTTNYTSGADDVGLFEFTALTADPWENQASADFRLSDSEGGGAVLRDNGMSFPAQTSYRDTNAFVTEPSGGGSSTVVTPGPVQVGM